MMQIGQFVCGWQVAMRQSLSYFNRGNPARPEYCQLLCRLFVYILANHRVVYFIKNEGFTFILSVRFHPYVVKRQTVYVAEINPLRG